MYDDTEPIKTCRSNKILKIKIFKVSTNNYCYKANAYGCQ